MEALGPELAEAGQILEVAPTPAVAGLLRQRSRANYVGLDIDPAVDGRSVDVIGDLCAAPFADDSIDVAVCFHVFEHIPNDGAAMSELARVLSSSGFAFVQVPWNRSAPTDEDPQASVKERIRRFGQADHIRLYGTDFEDRMHAAGLHTFRVAASGNLPAHAIEVMALRGTVWIAAQAGGEFAARSSEMLEALIRDRLVGMLRLATYPFEQ